MRIIPSKFPYVGVWDRIADPADIETLIKIERLTNPRVRQELGNLSLVRKEDMISGPGSTPIMAAFTNSLPSRFSDGTFGIFYCAHKERTAIAETRFHRARFYRATDQAPNDFVMRVYHAGVRGSFEDLREGQADSRLLDPEDYTVSQRFGRECFDANSDGIVYPSVRDAGGECVAAFRPRLISAMHPVKYLRYVWNGHTIIDVQHVESLTGAF